MRMLQYLLATMEPEEAEILIRCVDAAAVQEATQAGAPRKWATRVTSEPVQFDMHTARLAWKFDA